MNPSKPGIGLEFTAFLGALAVALPCWYGIVKAAIWLGERIAR
jgi:hypothetical protein